MKKFKIYLKEGGNAVEGVGRINQENVSDTLRSLYGKLLPKLKLKPSNISSLGSTGKKAPGGTSGDIDIGVEIKSLMRASKKKTLPDLYAYVFQVAKSLTATTVKDNRGFGTISFSFPIVNKDGKQAGKLIQVDLFLVDSLDYAGWVYYGPHYTESQLGGVYRNILIGHLAKYSSMKVLKSQAGEVTVRERLLFDLTRGLMKVVQSREGKTGIVKNFKTIDRELVSQNPQEIVNILFGAKYSPSDLLTFESVLKAIMSKNFPLPEARKNIIKDTENTLLELGYPIPEVLSRIK